MLTKPSARFNISCTTAQCSPHLIAPALIPSYGTAFVAGLAVVGMKSRVEVGLCTPELTRYRATWDR